MKHLTATLCLLLSITPLLSQTFFQHTVTDENKRGHLTELAHAQLDNNPNAKVFVTQNGKFNPHEVGVWYSNNKWHIFNQNRKELLAGTVFSVYVPPPNANNAFTVTTNSSNTSGHITTLDNGLVNAQAGALLFITQRYGKYNTSPVGVWYSGGRWKIYNESRAAMPEGTQFNVLVFKAGVQEFGPTKVEAFKYKLDTETAGEASIQPGLYTKENLVFLTNNYAGAYNTNTVGARYNGRQWTVFNHNGNTLAKGYQVNVFVPVRSAKLNLPGEVVVGKDLPFTDRDPLSIPKTPTLQPYKKMVKLPMHESAREITYFLDDEGMAVFEGDIILGEGHDFTIEEPEPHPTPRSFREYGTIGAEKYGKTSQAITIRRSDGVIDRNWLWPNGVIPYNIRLGFSDAEKAVIESAIDELNTRTNLNLFTTSLIMDKNIEFVKRDLLLGEAAGASRVGRNRTSRHRVRLKEGFSKAVVIHELLHAAGMWHEQSRRDRDRYVQIIWDNILDDYKSNFEIHDTDSENITPYDMLSIMHYSGMAFSKNGRPTIIERASGRPVPYTGRLSAYDIDGINTAYPVDYYGTVSREPTTLRTVSIEVQRIISRDLDGPGDENEFYIKSEIGPGFQWRPGTSSNPTRKQESGKKRTVNLEVHPEWTHSHLIQPGEQFVKIYLRLREDDGLASNENRDDDFNINPFPGIDHLELKINTFDNTIYLGDIDGVFREENFIGYVGDEIELEGFEGSFKAYIQFQVTIR